MIVKPELQQFGNLASEGLGLLFLKYSRDDESQADELGFRYMTAANYDPHEMAAMFHTLERMSGGSGSTPEWLSTHPDPGNRVAATNARIAAANKSFAGATVNHDSFLRHLEGMVYGEDPRQGYFDQMVYYHPQLRFQVTFPSGWKTQNQSSQVIGVSAAQDAILAISSAGTASPGQALAQFMGQQGVSAVGTSTSPINALPAALGQFTAQTQDGTLAGDVAFIQLDGATYRLLAYTTAAQVQAYDGIFRQSIGSFHRLTDAARLNVTPARMHLVQLASAMTLTQFNQQNPSSIPIAELALINGVEPTATIPAGTLVKRVTK